MRDRAGSSDPGMSWALLLGWAEPFRCRSRWGLSRRRPSASGGPAAPCPSQDGCRKEGSWTRSPCTGAEARLLGPERGGGKGATLTVAGDLNVGGGHTTQCTDKVSSNPTLETYIVLLTNVNKNKNHLFPSPSGQPSSFHQHALVHGRPGWAPGLSTPTKGQLLPPSIGLPLPLHQGWTLQTIGVRKGLFAGEGLPGRPEGQDS